MLNPQLSAALLQKSLDRSPAGKRLLGVKLKTRHLIGAAFLLIMIEIACQKYRARTQQPHVKDLMAGRVSVGGLYDYAAVAEDIEIVTVEGLRFAVLKRRIRGGGIRGSGTWGSKGGRPRLFREHCLPLRLLHNPCRTGKCIGIRGVIEMVVRQ